jgi:predicted carbohydrate-binding protein with CBM5 and CBM33 domain
MSAFATNRAPDGRTMTRERRVSIRKSALFLVSALSVLSTTDLAHAHGTVTSPSSRVYRCYQEGPESPDSAACRAAVAATGSASLYDWNGIRQGSANGNHRSVVPDGQLCSGGNPSQFGGLDLARSDWAAASVAPGALTFRWTLTAPHRTQSYDYYITRQGYDPTRPLRWVDLELFCHNGATGAQSAASHTCNLPSRSGRHVVYAVWQRSDSPEAFYACIDLSFGGDPEEPDDPDDPQDPGDPEDPDEPDDPQDPDPGGCASAAYRAGPYATGALVQHHGHEYRCLVGGWCGQGGPYEPGVGWAWIYAWEDLGACSAAGTQRQQLSLSDPGDRQAAGCDVGGRGGAGVALALAMLALATRRRHRRAREFSCPAGSLSVWLQD